MVLSSLEMLCLLLIVGCTVTHSFLSNKPFCHNLENTQKKIAFDAVVWCDMTLLHSRTRQKAILNKPQTQVFSFCCCYYWSMLPSHSKFLVNTPPPHTQTHTPFSQFNSPQGLVICIYNHNPLILCAILLFLQLPHFLRFIKTTFKAVSCALKTGLQPTFHIFFIEMFWADVFFFHSYRGY